ncbi:hypothetical protein [Allorhizocola rhizosphaerae]|uniref:hypothetical protein n=1 Tax=Allorhizocola rhizosphaerae TaxID=1872709 RepID=UPI000E3DCEEB|nr:hypothetical protein [Allorhizocola rhizosphaerae]
MNKDVHELVAQYLTDVDAALPGFVEMLYLTGSVALGAFQPGVSDIEALIVTSRSPSPADLAASLADRARAHPSPSPQPTAVPQRTPSTRS